MPTLKTAGPFTRFENRPQWQAEGELFRIDAFGPGALRFRGSKSPRISDQDWNLLPQPEARLKVGTIPRSAAPTSWARRRGCRTTRGDTGCAAGGSPAPRKRKHA